MCTTLFENKYFVGINLATFEYSYEVLPERDRIVGKFNLIQTREGKVSPFFFNPHDSELLICGATAGRAPPPASENPDFPPGEIAVGSGNPAPRRGDWKVLFIIIFFPPEVPWLRWLARHKATLRDPHTAFLPGWCRAPTLGFFVSRPILSDSKGS